MPYKRQSAKKLLKKNNTRNNRKSSRKSTRKRKARLSKINGGGDPDKTISLFSELEEISNSNNIVILEERKQEIINKLEPMRIKIEELKKKKKVKKGENKFIEYFTYFNKDSSKMALAKVEQKLDSEGTEVTRDSMFEFLKELNVLKRIFKGDEDRKIFRTFINEMYK